MTRSMADAAGAKCGVIAIPEIDILDVKLEDRFIIIGSDGIWEVISNMDAARVVMPYYSKKNAEGAGEALVREAYKRWKNVSGERGLTGVLYRKIL